MSKRYFVAHVVEQLSVKQWVTGSIPVGNKNTLSVFSLKIFVGSKKYSYFVCIRSTYIEGSNPSPPTN